MAVLLPSCGGQINFPVPVLKSLDPPFILAGQPTFSLIVNGSGFSPNSTVLWNGLPRITFFVTQSQMTAKINATDIQFPGTANISVFTPTPGGGKSAVLKFIITPTTSPVPQISSISPTTTFAGVGGLSLRITGTNFVSNSAVTVNGSSRPTSFANSTLISTNLTSADTAVAGSVQIAVVNPAPGGGASNTVLLPIQNPVPILTSLSPLGFVAGGTSATLALAGTRFTTVSQILINGSPRPTSFSSTTSISTTLTAGDLAISGINQVRVVNPPPVGGTSNLLAYAVNPTSSAGLPVLVDVSPNGTQASDGICGNACAGGILDLNSAGPSSNTTGQFVAFASISSNLTLLDPNSASDVFLRNSCLGSGATCTPTTSIQSANPANGPADGPSAEPSLSSTGSNIAFTSTATNLVTTVPPAGTIRQVYWRPTCTGAANCLTATNVMQLVSISADGTTAGNGDSFNPAISPDGRFVAFASLATNLVSNLTFDGVTPQIFIHDTCNGVTSSTCTPTTFLVSTPNGSTAGDGPSSSPAISNNGLSVSFTSNAKNLGATAPNPGGAAEIFVRQTCINLTTTCAPITNLVSTPDGTTAANGASGQSSIDNAGRFIAFASTATTLVIGSGPIQQIYVRDTCAGATGCTASTSLISTANGSASGNALSEHPSVNQSGQFIAFASFSSNLTGNIANGVENIYVRNTCATVTSGCTPATVLASQPNSSGATPANGNSSHPSVASNGKVISFISFADNLVANDTNGAEDIFLSTTTF